MDYKGLLDLQGAEICGDIEERNPPISLPNQSSDSALLAVDIGGTLIKLVYFEGNEEVKSHGKVSGGQLRFMKFQTSRLDDCLEFIRSKRLLYGGGFATGSTSKNVEIKMDFQNTPFTVQLGCGANIHLVNAVINTRDVGATIQFGGIDFPMIAAQTTTRPARDNHAQLAYQCSMLNQLKPLSLLLLRFLERAFVFERLGNTEALAMKRMMIGQTISVVHPNATSLLTLPFAQGQHDAEASSSGGKLTRR